MKRQIRIAAAVLCIGLWVAAMVPEGQPVVQAKGESQGEKEIFQMPELASRGNLVYRDGGKEAAIYAADFSLLYGKLSAVSGEVFDPAEYTHMHRWEYQNRDDRVHTKYCVLCGDTLTDVHKAESEEDCVISDGKKEYPGRRYQCVCGYQWEKEKAHVLTFDMVDETCHRSRCLLDGTEYCMGYEPVEEEHYAFSLTPDSSGTHNIKTCIDCGYQTEEEPDSPSVSENTVEEPAEIPDEEMMIPELSEAEASDGNTEKPEQEKLPASEKNDPDMVGPHEVSVSGNDCVVEEGKKGMESERKETADKEGEKR